MSERISLQLEEPGDDPLSDACFDILREAVQTDSTISLDNAAQQLLNLLPEGNPYSAPGASFLYGFLCTCYQVAEQIPYARDDSQERLVIIIESVLMSDRLSPSEKTKNRIGDRIPRVQMLSESARDWWNSSSPAEDASKYVNFQSFLARVKGRGLLKGSHLPTWTCARAFEYGQQDKDILEAYILGAAQWIIIFGHEVYQDVCAPSKERDILFPTARQWRIWRRGFEAAASGTKPRKTCISIVKAALSGWREQNYEGLREETRLVAKQAAENMVALERKRGVWSIK